MIWIPRSFSHRPSKVKMIILFLLALADSNVSLHQFTYSSIFPCFFPSTSWFLSQDDFSFLNWSLSLSLFIGVRRRGAFPSFRGKALRRRSSLLRQRQQSTEMASRTRRYYTRWTRNSRFFGPRPQRHFEFIDDGRVGIIYWLMHLIFFWFFSRCLFMQLFRLRCIFMLLIVQLVQPMSSMTHILVH